MRLNKVLWQSFCIIFMAPFSFGGQAAEMAPGPAQVHVISSVGIKLLSLQDLKFELNEFQEDCLNLLRNPLITGAQVELLDVEGGNISIRVSGKSSPTTKVGFANRKWTFLPIEGDSFEFQPAWEKQPVFIDNVGRFQFTVQIPALKKATVSLEFEDKVSQAYFLEIDFSNGRKLKRALLRPYFTEEQKRKFCTKSRATVSVGATAFLYNQKLESFNGSLDYATFDMPSYSLGLDWSRNPESDHSFWYRSAPGNISSSDKIKVNENYRWNTFDYHYSYGRPSWIRNFAGALIYSRIRLGLQQHELPVTQMDSATKVKISPVLLTNASLGFSLKAYSEKYWMYEFQIGAQYPLSSNLDLQYQTMFDGGVGIFFSYWKDYFLGFQWYGHLHKFTYSRAPGAFDEKGSVEFVYSSVELSIGSVF